MKPTTWSITKQGRVKRVKVPGRTQRQLERSRKNLTNPPPPVYSPRRRPS